MRSSAGFIIFNPPCFYFRTLHFSVSVLKSAMKISEMRQTYPLKRETLELEIVHHFSGWFFFTSCVYVYIYTYMYGNLWLSFCGRLYTYTNTKVNFCYFCFLTATSSHTSPCPGVFIFDPHFKCINSWLRNNATSSYYNEKLWINLKKYFTKSAHHVSEQLSYFASTLSF